MDDVSQLFYYELKECESPTCIKLRVAAVFVTFLLGISLMIAGNNVAFAASNPDYYGGAGGTISGIVVSPSGNVVDWSQIHAKNGDQTFECFSGFSGFYLLRVPAGTYNVSVYDFYNPPYWAPSVSVNVTDGSNTTVDFYLQLPPPIAVPEFQPNLLAVVAMLAIAASCIMARRSRKLALFH